MKEYTLFASVVVLVTVALDRFSGVRVLGRPLFYLYLAAILVFKLIVNGFLTAEGVFIYNPGFILGLRIGSIPLEDFLFGFSMVTQVIIFWEYFKDKT